MVEEYAPIEQLLAEGDGDGALRQFVERFGSRQPSPSDADIYARIQFARHQFDLATHATWKLIEGVPDFPGAWERFLLCMTHVVDSRDLRELVARNSGVDNYSQWFSMVAASVDRHDPNRTLQLLRTVYCRGPALSPDQQPRTVHELAAVVLAGGGATVLESVPRLVAADVSEHPLPGDLRERLVDFQVNLARSLDAGQGDIDAIQRSLAAFVVDALLLPQADAWFNLYSRVTRFAALNELGGIGRLLMEMGILHWLEPAALRRITDSAAEGRLQVHAAAELLHYRVGGDQNWIGRLYDNWLLPSLTAAIVAQRMDSCFVLGDYATYRLEQGHSAHERDGVARGFNHPVINFAETVANGASLPPLPVRAAEGEIKRIAVVFDRTIILGNTTIFFVGLAAAINGYYQDHQLVLVDFDGDAQVEPLASLLKKQQLMRMNLKGELGAAASPSDWVQAAASLRTAFAQHAIDTVVYLTREFTAAVFSALQLAPVQLYWSFSYRTPNFPHVDASLSFVPHPAAKEGPCLIEGHEWHYCRLLCKQVPPIDIGQVAEFRRQIGGDVVLATISRSEKLYSEEFISTLAAILKKHPEARYAWTGDRHPAVQALIERYGIADQCVHLGWVKGQVFSHAIDVFLDTFPFGNGHSAGDALQAGKPVISMGMEQSLYAYAIVPAVKGWFGPDLEQLAKASTTLADGSSAILVAADCEDYVAMADRLLTDSDYYREVAEASRKMGIHFALSGLEAAATFRDAIQRVRRRKLGYAAGIVRPTD